MAWALYGTCCVSLVLLATGVFWRHFQSSNTLPLPPGPKGWPLVGNTFQLPRGNPWRLYDKWSRIYDGLFSLSIAGNTFIVIGTVEGAREVLNKRAAQSSNRPHAPMANDLVSKGIHILLRNYDDGYKLVQRMLAPVFTPQAAASYAPCYEAESCQLLQDMLSEGPEPDFVRHIERYTLGLVYMLIYGMKVRTGKESYAEGTRYTMHAFADTATPGLYLVDTFPVLNRLPSWLAPWKREAEALYKEGKALHVSNMQAGLSNKGQNFAKQFRDSPQARELTEWEVAYHTGILTHAGYETQAFQLEWFVVACLTFPAKAAKAQTQLDEVVGRERLPRLADKPNLPYITAFVEEVLRWRSILNSGIPHVSSTEFEYLGYRIPRNAVIIANFWSIDHDETHYRDPHDFVPERWLKEAEKENMTPVAAFGFGRRTCPGRNVARNSLFVAIARLLWAFDIKPARDERGQDVVVDATATADGLNTRPLPFAARFLPRDSDCRSVVEHEAIAIEQTA